jgi:hypothetical protein
MHRTTEHFWRRHERLDERIRKNADKAFALLRKDSMHPSLRFKRIGAFWSARVDAGHRALAVEDGEDFIWVWIGPHDEYERIVRGR